ncbi:MAG TPA: class I SAM-dependent methyltransferase [Sandaracinaceae bacterium LLY-WYZ-13_1]|nr:class I SAM-dependent methyltransferase [Sandaracinaceae bacterium LLY-WYZ-13_1]
MDPPARDVGLGTAYERWAVYRLLARWARPVPRTALEGPLDGMAGMPGLHLLGLARRGTRVTVAHPSEDALARVRTVYRRAGLEARLRTVRSAEPPAGPFEAVVAFNVAPLVHDWRGWLDRLLRRATRFAVVVATHPGSYGAWLRRGLRHLEPRAERAPELFEHEACRPEVMRRALARGGRGVVDERWVDCPWWPDLFVSAGETLGGATLRRLRGSSRGGARTRWDAGPEAFPFAPRDDPAALRRARRRHPHFEDAPAGLARWFAHHRAYLVAPRGADRRDGPGDRAELP